MQQPDIAVMDIPDPLAFRDLQKGGANRNLTGTRGHRTPGMALDTAYVEPKLSVVRALRDDPLASLHHHHHITDAQYHAGRRWQAYYEDSQIGRVRSSGDIREPVDGSRPPVEPLSPRQQLASKMIARLDGALGAFGASLVRDVLGSGLSIAQSSAKHGMIANRGTKEFLGKRFRECLDTLAREFGFQGERHG